VVDRDGAHADTMHRLWAGWLEIGVTPVEAYPVPHPWRPPEVCTVVVKFKIDLRVLAVYNRIV
jgi:hypothetical protein